MGIIIFLLGLCVGSFINMAVYRLAVKYDLIKKSKSILKNKRSFCDNCGKQLKWLDNVPVLSWLILGGRSRCCDQKLDWYYPLVELLTGVLFFLNYSYDFGLVNYPIIGLLVFLMVFDLKFMILPDLANISLILLSLLLLVGKSNWISYLVCGMVSGLFFLVLNRIRIRGTEAMGMGDVIYVIFAGLYLGYPGVIVAFYVAFIVGAVVSIGLLVARVVKKETPIPFGPFLILGTVVAKMVKF